MSCSMTSVDGNWVEGREDGDGEEDTRIRLILRVESAVVERFGEGYS